MLQKVQLCYALFYRERSCGLVQQRPMDILWTVILLIVATFGTRNDWCCDPHAVCIGWKYGLKVDSSDILNSFTILFKSLNIWSILIAPAYLLSMYPCFCLLHYSRLMPKHGLLNSVLLFLTQIRLPREILVIETDLIEDNNILYCKLDQFSQRLTDVFTFLLYPLK